MLKKEISYTDYNGESRSEDFYFNMTRTEMAELDIDAGGVLIARLNRMVQRKDGAGMARFFRDFIVKSYGEKTDDGRFFDKGENFSLGKRFTRSPAFDVLFMELLTDPTGEKIRAFFLGVVPPEMAAEAQAQTNPNVVVGDFGENNN